MRKRTKQGERVQDMLYSTFKGNSAAIYGSEMENNNTKLTQQGNSHPDVTVDDCGLFVSRHPCMVVSNSRWASERF